MYIVAMGTGWPLPCVPPDELHCKEKTAWLKLRATVLQETDTIAWDQSQFAAVLQKYVAWAYSLMAHNACRTTCVGTCGLLWVDTYAICDRVCCLVTWQGGMTTRTVGDDGRSLSWYFKLCSSSVNNGVSRVAPFAPLQQHTSAPQ